MPFNPAKTCQEEDPPTSTFFKIKGLESHAVVLADLDKLYSPLDRRRVYVSMPRAKKALYLLGAWLNS